MSKQNKHSGGGSNILRGGKRSYECGTLIGNFVEEAYRPGVVRSQGFTSSMYTTSTQLQQSGGAVKPAFGPALQNNLNPRYDYTNLVGPDTLHAPSTWVPASKTCDFHPRDLKTATMTGPDLEAYRQKWTKEQRGVKELRFSTEAIATQGIVVPAQFKPRHLLPTDTT
ncbi:hypothetical protein DYB37_006488 [Aphanomyces astaci]|uniref:Uncharacterized protein n=1 Tax=Aphanomyces astaci TaxID=112090 RepID=A0A397E2E9_APHAT|nr:hypothetical protein DYB25_001958 [Aphanomyces astaci]RHY23611.1 hypothetical protein DYB36_004148 [Aphanomyces astaci]RHY72429.1 hypothetical protein DYB30_007835 [Aphanomyces astaci]RHY88329.1 hypothetical protein DYB35_009596 [Aphanomyces astaci]RHZ02162.1 hypothetical protein DYB26_012429 [Aphanomyces astaci]